MKRYSTNATSPLSTRYCIPATRTTTPAARAPTSTRRYWPISSPGRATSGSRWEQIIVEGDSAAVEVAHYLGERKYRTGVALFRFQDGLIISDRFWYRILQESESVDAELVPEGGRAE